MSCVILQEGRNKHIISLPLIQNMFEPTNGI